jgi:peroxiredoxin
MTGPLTELPANLPKPEDDGGALHLIGASLPAVMLRSTSGFDIDLGSLRATTVIFAYPMTGEPGKALPTDWISIPGAAGCTLETCGFRDHHKELIELGATVYGLSTQPTDVQAEAKERLHLPFDLLSDANLFLTRSLNLPSMSPDGIVMIKRLTLICNSRNIRHVFYPVFPPDTHADQVVSWLRNQNAEQSDAVNPHAFGTFGTSAAEQPLVPKAGGDT